MKGLELDFTILHFFLKDKRNAAEISKEVTIEYMDPKVQLFYGTMLKHYANPSIRGILSQTALQDYCRTYGLEEQIPRFLTIYQKAAELKHGGEEPKSEDIRYYIQQMRERRTGQIAKESIDRLNEILANPTVSNEEITKAIQETVSKVNSVNKIQIFDEGTVAADIDNMIAEYEAIRLNPTPFRGVLTGYPSFDNRTNGLHKGELTIIAGMESSGKSLLMMNMAINAWLGTNGPGKDFAANGRNVIYFSLEMPRSNKGEYTQGPYFNKRVLSCVSELKLKEIQNASLNPGDYDKLLRTRDFVKEYEQHYRFHVVDIPRGATVEDIEAKFVEINNQYPVDLVVADYLGIMACKGDVPDHLAQGHIAEQMHEFARTYNIPVLTAAQLNRPTGTKGQSLNEQSYNGTRLARSAMVGQNANNVLMIATRDDEHDLEDMIIHITKCRDGQKGTIVFSKRFECMRVYDGSPFSAMNPEVALFEDLGTDSAVI